MNRRWPASFASAHRSSTASRLVTGALLAMLAGAAQASGNETVAPSEGVFVGSILRNLETPNADGPTTSTVPAGKAPFANRLPSVLATVTGDPAFAAFEAGRYRDALALAEAAAAEGQAEAHTLLGRLYEEGLGVAVNATEAATWYAQGAERGDVNGKFKLAMLLLRGEGIPKDPSLAARLFREAADAGLPEAQYNLALLHVTGSGVPSDMTEAARLLQAAAEQRHPAAQYDLGVLYLSGEGVAKDEAAAARWIRRAADRGLDAAQVEYAVMLWAGRGVAADRARATWYLRAAAESGNPVAQNRLARIYAYGEGVEPDITEAVKWHLLARGRGASDFGLDRYMARLTVEERDAGERAAAEWLDRNVAER